MITKDTVLIAKKDIQNTCLEKTSFTKGKEYKPTDINENVIMQGDAKCEEWVDIWIFRKESIQKYFDIKEEAKPIRVITFLNILGHFVLVVEKTELSAGDTVISESGAKLLVNDIAANGNHSTIFSKIVTGEFKIGEEVKVLSKENTGKIIEDIGNQLNNELKKSLFIKKVETPNWTATVIEEKPVNLGEPQKEATNKTNSMTIEDIQLDINLAAKAIEDAVKCNLGVNYIVDSSKLNANQIKEIADSFKSTSMELVKKDIPKLETQIVNFKIPTSLIRTYADIIDKLEAEKEEAINKLEKQ